MNKSIFAIAFSAVWAISAAQFDFGGGATSNTPAWKEFKLPKTTMKLDFRNSSPDMVIAMFSKTSGITIVKDPALVQPLTLTTAKAVSLDQAFEVLNAALSLRNFDLKKEGNLLVIRARKAQTGRGNTGFQMPTNFTMPEQPKTELKVYQLTYAAASNVARTINEVFAGQNSGGGLPSFFNMGGRGGAFGGRGGGMSSFMSAMGGQQSPGVRASSEDYSNSVIVNATSSQHRDVADLIKQIDKVTDVPMKAKVYKLEFANSSDLQPVVQNVLNSNQPLGRGARSQTPNVDRQFSFFPFGGGNQNRNQTTVVSDTRTNALVVTTTEENHKLVDEIIKDLDTKIEMQSTTFVFPLNNARADDVANLMRQAFGNRQGAGRNGGTNTGRTTQNSQRTGTQNRNNGGGNTGGGFNGVGGENQGDSLPIDVNEDGELTTDVVAQGFGFFGGQGQGQNQQNRNNAQQTGRDAQGRVIPVQDLTNQVTVIPDPNTNSVIVVTTPDNAELLKRILDQLDKIPEQVMIETMIVEATLSSSDKLGVEWNFSQAKAFGDQGVTGAASTNFGIGTNPQGFKYTLGGGNLSAMVNALKSDTKFQVLSTPRIFTSNNQEAEINISQRVPYVVSQRTDANGNITYNYNYQDVGIVLNVTPRITSNGYVTMDVLQTANDLQGFTSFNAPIVNQRQAQTTVSVKDSETLVLGGIMRTTVNSTVNKVPLLGDLPLLGSLFRSTSHDKAKTELLVFLTPHVVRDQDEATKLRKDEENKLSKDSLGQIEKARGGTKDQGKVEPPKTGGGGN